ncbi:unnamed protein product, partial [marine sediment metagenome]
DLNYDLMARVLRVPDEKFRDKMAKSMREWVTTLRRELGEPPTVGEVKAIYSNAFQDILGVDLVKGEPSELEWEIFNEETKPRHTSREWLYMEAPPAQRREGRAVKIAHDVKMVEADHKAKKLIRIRAEMMGQEIMSVQIRGDLFVIPKEAVATLEEMLAGVKLEEEELMNILDEFYDATHTGHPLLDLHPHVIFMVVKVLGKLVTIYLNHGFHHLGRKWISNLLQLCLKCFPFLFLGVS